MSPETARHRAALRLAFAATLAMVWGTMVREPLPGLTAVLACRHVPPATPAPGGGAGYRDRGYRRCSFRRLRGVLGPAAGSDGCARAVVLHRLCDARTGGGPALPPCHHAAE